MACFCSRGITPEGAERFRIGDRIVLHGPDGSAIDTQIDGLEFPCPNPRGELVLHLKGLTKEDVPVGTEIWSSDG